MTNRTLQSLKDELDRLITQMAETEPADITFQQWSEFRGKMKALQILIAKREASDAQGT